MGRWQFLSFDRACLLIALAMLVGCRACPAPTGTSVATTRPVEYLKRPAIDLTRGGAGFPLATSIPPANPAALRNALAEGYAKRLTDRRQTRITVEPATRPTATQPTSFESVSIDLTGNTVRSEFVPKNPPHDAKSVGTIAVNNLHYTAEPLNYQTYSAGMELQASDAVLSMIAADEESLMLNLIDCSTGRVRFDLSVDSLKHSLSQGVNIKRSAAFMIDSIELGLQSDNPHALAVDAMVHSRVFFLPASFRITGRIDVDDAFFVHFSNLLARGNGPTGMLVAQIVQSKLDLVNDKAAPLLRMPGDKIHVTDLKIALTDVLTVDVGVAGTR